jgi:hypothetical protein
MQAAEFDYSGDAGRPTASRYGIPLPSRVSAASCIFRVSRWEPMTEIRSAEEK